MLGSMHAASAAIVSENGLTHSQDTKGIEHVAH